MAHYGGSRGYLTDEMSRYDICFQDIRFGISFTTPFRFEREIGHDQGYSSGNGAKSHQNNTYSPHSLGPPIHPPHLSMRKPKLVDFISRLACGTSILAVSLMGVAGASAPMPTPANRITDEEQRKWQANYSEGVEKQKKKNKKALRTAGGSSWSDPSLLEWDKGSKN